MTLDFIKRKKKNKFSLLYKHYKVLIVKIYMCAKKPESGLIGYTLSRRICFFNVVFFINPGIIISRIISNFFSCMNVFGRNRNDSYVHSRLISFNDASNNNLSKLSPSLLHEFYRCYRNIIITPNFLCESKKIDSSWKNKKRTQIWR